MRIQTRSLSCGKKITIFDDVFSYRDREYFESFAKNLSFVHEVNGHSRTTKHLPTSIFHCRFRQEDDKNLGLYAKLKKHDHFKFLNDLQQLTSWVNLTVPCSIFHTHTDAGNDPPNEQETHTLLYYVNCHWEDWYGGETIFYNSFREKEIVVDFVPGRLIMFNSTIPHKPAYTYAHTYGRYSYVTLLKGTINKS